MTFKGSFHHQLRSTMLALVVIVLGTLVSTAYAGGPPVFVTSGNNHGEGSLREALESGATNIIIKQSVPDIEITETLEYIKSDTSLSIKGFGQTIKAGDDFTLLSITMGADLSVSKVNFQGKGDFSASSQGSGKGIFVDVPLDRTGTVHLELSDVSVSGVAFHGIHVSDCTLADACGSGSGGGGEGSPASIHASLKRVTVSDVGNGKFDGDGVRIDERGEGDIICDVLDSSVWGAGADGVELDEGDEGSVYATVKNSVFNHNGGYCEIVEAYPLLDPNCFDEGELDLDDGFDIDEAGDGSLVVDFNNVTVNHNFDEGLDFDEEGPGDIIARFKLVSADGNYDEGIKCSEEDVGNVDIELTACTVTNTQFNDGMEFESEDQGRIDVFVVNTEASGNGGDDPDRFDLRVLQDFDTDLGSLKIISSSNIGSMDTDNVVVEMTGN